MYNSLLKHKQQHISATLHNFSVVNAILSDLVVIVINKHTIINESTCVPIV